MWWTTSRPVSWTSPATASRKSSAAPRGYIGYAEADWKNPAAPWKFHPISPKGGYQRFTHGIGCGDINGDGRIDIIEKDGWWEQPASLANDPVWIKHPFHFRARRRADARL